jgi:hypothetical protein
VTAFNSDDIATPITAARRQGDFIKTSSIVCRSNEFFELPGRSDELEEKRRVALKLTQDLKPRQCDGSDKYALAGHVTAMQQLRLQENLWPVTGNRMALLGRPANSKSDELPASRHS